MKKHFLFYFFIVLLFTGCNQPGEKQKTGRQPAEPLCFESTSPNASRATPLYDYLQLSISGDGNVEGMGAGFVMAGSMQWVSNAKGTLSGDTLKLKVIYEVENAEYEGYQGPFTLSETWYFDSDKKHLWRNNSAALKNWLGEKEYHTIGRDEIPADCAARFKKITLR